MTENEPDREFVREQYAQYWEMLRLHLNFSWQLPALAVGAVVALLGLGPTSVSQWTKAPLIPATTFLLIGFFFTVIFVHHHRNHMFVRLYENALVRLEERYGVRLEVHHLQIQPKLKWKQRISSSALLSALLALVALSSMIASIYFFGLLF